MTSEQMIAVTEFLGKFPVISITQDAVSSTAKLPSPSRVLLLVPIEGTEHRYNICVDWRWSNGTLDSYAWYADAQGRPHKPFASGHPGTLQNLDGRITNLEKEKAYWVAVEAHLAAHGFNDRWDMSSAEGGRSATAGNRRGTKNKK